MRETLQIRLQRRARFEMTRPRRAAVLVPVVSSDDGPSLLLTRRAEDLPTHKGQVAFPGGHVDPGDAGPVEAALREAWEEVALPGAQVEVLGMLDDFPTVTDEVAVTPVVGWIEALPPLVPEAGEVARIFSVPIEALQDGRAWRRREYERDGQRWPVFYFDWEGETLWGLSAYVTLQLLSLLPGGGPFRLPLRRPGR